MALSRVVVDLGKEERAGVVPQSIDAVGHLVDPRTDLRDEGGGHARGLLPLHMDGGAGCRIAFILFAEKSDTNHLRFLIKVKLKPLCYSSFIRTCDVADWKS